MINAARKLLAIAIRKKLAKNVADAKSAKPVIVNMNKKFIYFILLCLVVFITALLFYSWNISKVEPVTNSSWIDIELVDIASGKSFKLSDFDAPIILESFAVWCPTCKKQQDEIKKLANEETGFFYVSINTDPNENEEKVLGHIEENSYDWYFAVFPVNATRMLIRDFGTNVVNAPSAPVIIICPNTTSRLLSNGVKDAKELKEEVAKC